MTLIGVRTAQREMSFDNGEQETLEAADVQDLQVLLAFSGPCSLATGVGPPVPCRRGDRRILA